MTFIPNPAADVPRDAVSVALGDAVRTISVAGDAVMGIDLGFGTRVGSLAAALARRLKLDEAAQGAVGYAGMWHHVGLAGVPLDSPFVDRSERAKEIASWEAPLVGAALARATPAMPAAVSDAIRWHREWWDGTGFPDRLRWNAIPAAAAAVGVSRAFLAATCSRNDPREPDEALYELMNNSGRMYSVALLRAFRETIVFEPDAYAPGAEPAVPPLYGDPDSPRALVTRIAHAIDERDPATHGRTERVIRSIAATAAALELDRDVVDRASTLAAFLTIGDLAKTAIRDEVDPLARMSRDRRAPEIALARRLARATGTYTPYAALLSDTTEWYESKRDALAPEARLVAIASAYELLARGGASLSSSAATTTLAERLYAAAGTQFDPTFVSAFVAELRR
jgi:response regulator RpfG family c-di-GMP phosphodiesterase